MSLPDRTSSTKAISVSVGAFMGSRVVYQVPSRWEREAGDTGSPVIFSRSSSAGSMTLVRDLALSRSYELRARSASSAEEYHFALILFGMAAASGPF